MEIGFSSNTADHDINSENYRVNLWDKCQHNDVICSFSGIFEYEESIPGGYIKIDMTDIPGTNGYCSDEAADEIRKRIKDFTPDGIHFLDNGNYHYVSRFWIEKISRPFDLIVFDNHTDMQPSGLLPVLSCGSWILDSLQDERIPIHKVYLIGPEQEAFDKVEDGSKTGVELIDRAAANEKSNRIDSKPIKQGFQNDYHTENYPVYISIDKDVLSEEEIKVNWDQGIMTAETLEMWIGRIAENREIIGIDICGEPEKTADAEQIARSDCFNGKMSKSCKYYKSISKQKQ